MEILDNARIVAYLTDKEIGSVWHCAEDLILSVERSEKKLECLEQHKNCKECLSFECIGCLDFGAIEHFNGKWRKAIESLNLDDLHKWLVDDSKDKTEMEFRLNKVKGIVGNMWNNDELKQLHNKLNGTFETGGIVPRMIRIIATLKENETEESATETVNKWWEILSVIMFNIELVQSRMQAIINETESILNPKPDTTKEKGKTVKQLPPELNTPQAHNIWNKAKTNGWISSDYSFNGTKYQMAFAAECMAAALRLKPKWKPFEILWNYKYFPQTRRESKERFGKVDREADIEKVFSL